MNFHVIIKIHDCMIHAKGKFDNYDNNFFFLNRQCALACLEDVSRFLTRGGQVAVSVTISYNLICNFYLFIYFFNIKLK